MFVAEEVAQNFHWNTKDFRRNHENSYEFLSNSYEISRTSYDFVRYSKSCSICDGYFDDDGLGDILFIEEEPNNRNASCNLCGKIKNIVQMKGTGQYLCQNACDDTEEETEEETDED